MWWCGGGRLPYSSQNCFVSVKLFDFSLLLSDTFFVQKAVRLLFKSPYVVFVHQVLPVEILDYLFVGASLVGSPFNAQLSVNEMEYSVFELLFVQLSRPFWQWKRICGIVSYAQKFRLFLLI